MAALIDAIDIKRKMFFELDGTPFTASTLKEHATARGGPDSAPRKDAEPAYPRRL